MIVLEVYESTRFIAVYFLPLIAIRFLLKTPKEFYELNHLSEEQVQNYIEVKRRKRVLDICN
jgi:hypothetical protein